MTPARLLLMLPLLAAPPAFAQAPAPSPWIDVLSPTAADLWGVTDNGYAVGSGGTILERVNGAWIQVQSPVTTDLLDVTEAGIAVGRNGVVLERGASGWLIANTPAAADLHGVDDAGFAVGAASTVLQRDQTGTWRSGPVFGNAEWVLEDVHAGLVVGHVDTVARALDVSAPTWRDVSPAGPLPVRLSGSAGNLASTFDGSIYGFDGTTWTQQHAGEMVLNGVSPADFAVGEEGTILQRRDGAWIEARSGTGTLTAISTQACYAVGKQGLILERLDAAGCTAPPTEPCTTPLGLGADCLPKHHADLWVPTFETSPPHLSFGSGATFTAVIENRGLAPAPATTARLLIDGLSAATQPVPPLAPGGRATLHFPQELAAGIHTATVHADALDEVVEPVEADNQRSLAFIVAEMPETRPDLVPVSLVAEPAVSDEGDEVRLTATIRNAGPGAAATFRVRFEIDGASHAERTIPALLPGASAEVAASVAATRGAHAVLVKADAVNEVAEHDEENNDLQGTYTVRDPGVQQPDLVIAGISHDPPAPSTSDGVVLYVVARNQGTGPAPASSLRVVVNGTHDRSTPALAANQDAVIAVPIGRLPSGLHNATATVDHAALVTESAETNNQRTHTIPVETPPALAANLQVIDARLIPASPAAGAEAVLAFTLRNVGDGTAGAFTTRILGPEAIDVRVAGVAAGSRENVTVTLRLPSGTHDVRLVADWHGEVIESSETDNFARLQAPVAAPAAGGGADEAPARVPWLPLAAGLLAAGILLVSLRAAATTRRTLALVIGVLLIAAGLAILALVLLGVLEIQVPP